MGGVETPPTLYRLTGLGDKASKGMGYHAYSRVSFCTELLTFAAIMIMVFRRDAGEVFM